MTLNPKAVRGTCAECGRWVVTYPRRGDNARCAHAHNRWQNGETDAQVWTQCMGSNEPVKA